MGAASLQYNKGFNLLMKNLISKTHFSVQEFLNKPHVKNLVAFGDAIADGFTTFTENPTPIGMAKATFSLAQRLVTHLAINEYDYFTGNWSEIFSRDFNNTIASIVKDYNAVTIRTSDEGSKIKIVDLGCGKIGWVESDRRNGEIYCIYGENHNLDQIREMLTNLLRKRFIGKQIVIRKSSFMEVKHGSDSIVLEIDEHIKPLKSELSDKYSSYVKAANEKNINRSLMFYGPPGSGKSTLSRMLVKELQYQAIRIKIEDVDMLDSQSLIDLIDIFKPDAIILDDFDRAQKQYKLLELLEFLHENVKLVIATINEKDALDLALLRPGRFDELVFVDKMNDDVIYSILGKENEDLFDLVSHWPVVFISELVTRIKFMPKEEARRSISELAARVDKLSKYREKDEINQLIDKNDHENYDQEDEDLERIAKETSKLEECIEF